MRSNFLYLCAGSRCCSDCNMRWVVRKLSRRYWFQKKNAKKSFCSIGSYIQSPSPHKNVRRDYIAHQNRISALCDGFIVRNQSFKLSVALRHNQHQRSSWCAASFKLKKPLYIFTVKHSSFLMSALRCLQECLGTLCNNSGHSK